MADISKNQKERIAQAAANALKDAPFKWDAQWTFWQATGEACYLIGIPFETKSKVLDGPVTALRKDLPDARVALLGYGATRIYAPCIIITPEKA